MVGWIKYLSISLPPSVYLHTVLEDAKVYSEHANKKSVDLEDLTLAVNLTLDKTHDSLPSKEVRVVR